MFDSHRGQKIFFFTSCGSLIPFTRANAQWVIHGFISTLIFTSELILCFTIFISWLVAPCQVSYSLNSDLSTRYLIAEMRYIK